MESLKLARDSQYKPSKKISAWNVLQSSFNLKWSSGPCSLQKTTAPLSPPIPSVRGARHHIEYLVWVSLNQVEHSLRLKIVGEFLLRKTTIRTLECLIRSCFQQPDYFKCMSLCTAHCFTYILSEVRQCIVLSIAGWQLFLIV